MLHHNVIKQKLAAAKEEEEKAKGLLELEKKKKKKQKEKEEKDKLQATAAAAAVESSKDSTSKNASNNLDQAIEKLLKVFYFGRLFDTSMGNTLAHYERAAYLGYDGLMKSEPAPGLMTQKHLDGLAAFAYYLSSRPMNQLLSHKQALDQCVALAKEFLDETKEKKMEVPLPDGTFCDLEAMIDRVTLTGFFSAVPQLQSFGDFSNNNNLQQPSGTPAAAGDDMTGGLLNTNTNTNTNIKIDNATHDTTTMVNSWEESQSVQPALISMPVAQNQSQQGFAPPEHQPQHQHRNAAHMEGGAVQKEMVKMTNGSEKKFQPRQKKTGQKGSRGPNRDHRAAANQSQSHEQAHVNQNVPALTEMDANQHQPASFNANYKKSANKRERSNNNNNLNKKATAGAGPGETGNPKKTSSNKEGDPENKGTTRKNWNRSSGPRQRPNGSNIRKGNGSKRDNPKQPPVSIK